MPPTLNEQRQAKCDRLKALQGQLQTILAAAKDRQLTAEEAAQCDAATTEADTLKAELESLKADKLRRAKAEGLGGYLDESDPPPTQTLGQPLNAEQGLRDFAAGRYRLRHFVGQAGHLAAYQAGILMLARVSTGACNDWAMLRCRDMGLNVHQLSPFQGEDGNSMGGYLVFPEFEATLINLKEQYGVLQQNAFKLPMASDTLIVPRRAGGATVYYPGENSQLTESAMKFDQVQLIAKKYACMTRWSTELNEDSVIAMADLLAGEFAYQFAKAEDTNGANGDGTATYVGTVGFLDKFKNGTNGVAPAGSVTTATGHTTVGALTLGDFETLVGQLPVYAEGRAKWYMHKTTFWAGPARLIDAAGGNIAMYLTSGTPLKFMGYEVVLMQAMPAQSALTTATYGIVLGDMLSTCFLGTRRGVSVKTSDQRYIEFDQIAIQSTQRVAINNVVGDSVAPATVAGPMVCLKMG